MLTDLVNVINTLLVLSVLLVELDVDVLSVDDCVLLVEFDMDMLVIVVSKIKRKSPVIRYRFTY